MALIDVPRDISATFSYQSSDALWKLATKKSTTVNSTAENIHT
jgi:hypothetical protein